MTTSSFINNSQSSSDQPGTLPVACIGLDWGDKTHAFAMEDLSGSGEEGTIAHSAENLHAWLRKLALRYKSQPVALAIEASRGTIIHALMEYPWLTIYPINPVTSARYRSAFRPSGAKDDIPDARVLLELVRDHRSKLRPLEPQDPATQLLAALVEARRDMVDRRTQVILQLVSLLKTYYPQALELVGNLKTELATAFLKRWPDLLSLKAAKPATIKRFYYQYQVRSTQLVEQRLALIANAQALSTDQALISVAVLKLHPLLDQLEVFAKHIPVLDAEVKKAFAHHPNAELFRDLPGAGPQMAPRLCAAFGTNQSLYPNPASMQKYWGLAPVMEKSGGQVWIHWRWQAPTFLRQTFVEWAGQTVKFSTWARTFYQRMRAKGKNHATIIRALAFRWIRVLWKCWQTRTPYNEDRYLQQLKRRKSSNMPREEKTQLKPA